MKVLISGGCHTDEKDRESEGYTITVEGNEDDKPEDVAIAYKETLDKLQEAD